jgi:hypothetical protein
MKRDEALAEFDTQDRAINYLAAFPPRIAAVEAVKAAKAVRIAWNRTEVDDRRPVYLSTEEETWWLIAAVKKYSADPLWGKPIDSSLLALFTKHPPDVASFIAYKVAWWAWDYDGRTFA